MIKRLENFFRLRYNNAKLAAESWTRCWFWLTVSRCGILREIVFFSPKYHAKCILYNFGICHWTQLTHTTSHSNYSKQFDARTSWFLYPYPLLASQSEVKIRCFLCYNISLSTKIPAYPSSLWRQYSDNWKIVASKQMNKISWNSTHNLEANEPLNVYHCHSLMVFSIEKSPEILSQQHHGVWSRNIKYTSCTTKEILAIEMHYWRRTSRISA